MAPMMLVKDSVGSGYVILHGALAELVDRPEGVEVVVGPDGEPFSTSMEAIACAKVGCSEEWQVVAVRTSDRLARPSVLGQKSA